MRLRHPTRNLLWALGLVAAGAGAGQPDASMLAYTCAGCHGTHGSSWGPATPTIAGMSEDHFIESMRAFREQERPATIMDRIARGYTEEEVRLMAAFFADQAFVRRPQPHDAELARRGAGLHEEYCGKCHKDGGRASEKDSGILAGQPMAYLRYSFADILSGERQVSRKMMKKIDALREAAGSDGIEALVHFYASQQ